MDREALRRTLSRMKIIFDYFIKKTFGHHFKFCSNFVQSLVFYNNIFGKTVTLT